MQGFGFELGDDGYGNTIVADMSLFGPAKRSGVVNVGDFLIAIDDEVYVSATPSIAISALAAVLVRKTVTFTFGS